MKKTALFLFILTSSLTWSQDVIMQTTTVSQCSGMFYDSGGATGNYSSNESFELTICPDSPGDFVSVFFSSFSLQLTVDTLEIFDGSDSSSASFGIYSGSDSGDSPGFITATQLNTSGCLTFVFTSDGLLTSDGWEAIITCFQYCQTIIAQLDSVTPMPDSDGYIKVCENEEIILMGSGDFSVDGTGATYEWDLGDGRTISGQNATFSYPNPGVYIANLFIRDTNTAINSEGCPNTNLINQIIYVSLAPDFTGTTALNNMVCFGESTTIDGVVQPTTFVSSCTPPVSGVFVLPDRAGATYETSITVDCYESTQTITSVDQIVEVCINLEHSFSGDLVIRLISPTGQNLLLYGATGGGIYFGGANNFDDQTPGVGAEYCFNASAIPTIVNGATIVAGSNPPNLSWEPGVYQPDGNFNDLLGSSLNGIWTLQLVDNLSNDDGTVFGWGIEFDPSLLSSDLSFTPAIVTQSWDAEASITTTVGNTITVAPSTSGQHCYTYRVVDDFGCEYTEEVCITVLPEIITAAPNNLFLCNPGAASSFVFNLSQNDAVVSLAVNPDDLNVTYYETQLDAENETASISNPMSYVSSATIGAPQDIFIRIEYLTSDCYQIETFTLNISNQPILNSVMDIELCDGALKDGFENFDLESQTATILGAQLAANNTVTYHASFADADANTGALVSPYQNVVNPQPIFVRIQNNVNPDCYLASTIAAFNLVVTSPIITTITEYSQCDDATDGDDSNGFVIFDLTTQTNALINGQANVVATFFETQIDSQSNISPINTPANYTNIVANNQVIYVRLDNTVTGCFSLTSFSIAVKRLPELQNVTLSACDDLDANFMESNDGFFAFDLTEANSQIANNINASLVYTYYETLIDSESDSNAISTPTSYTNTALDLVTGLPVAQTLFVRVTNTNTGCFSLTSLIISVLENPSPSPNPDRLILCDSNNPGDMMESFNLTQNEVNIINGETDVTLIYYVNQSDAIVGDISKAITDPMNHINEDPLNPGIGINPQTIYVRVENTGVAATATSPEVSATGCYSLVSFDVIVSSVAVITPIDDYVICELFSDGQADFDLESITPAILNGQDPTVFNVTYYNTLADAQAGASNNLISPYTNLTNPQTIYVNISNLGCSVTTLSFNIEEQEAAQANPDGQAILYEVCDDNMDFDNDSTNNTVIFNLETQNIFVLDGQDPIDYNVTYYETQADADAATNALPLLYENRAVNNNVANTQVIYARVDNNIMVADGTGVMTDSSVCYDTTVLTLQVNPMPAFNLEDSYLLCVNNDTTEIIDAPIIDTELSTALYTFEWRFENNVLINETGASIEAATAGNYSVIVTNRVTGCESIPISTIVQLSTPAIVSYNITSLAFANQHDVFVSATNALPNSIAEYEFSLAGGTWQLGELNPNTQSYDYTFTNIPGGTIEITVRDINGCGETTIEVPILDFPVYFTPNGDAINETWNIYNIENQLDAKIYIFNRFGKLIKQLRPNGPGWNGTYNGNIMPTSDYWFRVEYTEPGTTIKKIFKSHFTLKR